LKARAYATRAARSVAVSMVADLLACVPLSGL
jgi:hypothetical protein